MKDKNGNTDIVGTTPALLVKAGTPVYKYASHDKLKLRIEEAAKAAGK